ncbi:MAG: large subunit ribosomal protein L25 [Chlamydiales bacterium]|jgi:large subunit ribosomal protein L25
MSEITVLKAKLRTALGSRSARKLRREGLIPASIPTDGEHEHVNVSLDERQFLATRRHHVHLYDIDVEGNVESALVRELQWDSMGDQITHVEFKRVQRGVKTETEVPIEVVGQPKSGTVTLTHSEIRVLVLPSLIPDSIEVRVGEMEAGTHVKASELVLPEGCELAVDGDLEVLVVAAERIVVEEESGDDEDGEPEVIDGKGDGGEGGSEG